MVAIHPDFLSGLGAGRTAFIATNGRLDMLVIEGRQQDEYRQRIREGWKVVAIRPICRSLNPKLLHNHPDLERARAYSYTLIVLEHPDLRPDPDWPRFPAEN